MLLSCLCVLLMQMIVDECVFFFFKQNTAYEVRISDWSSDVCSSDLNLITENVRNGYNFMVVKYCDLSLPLIPSLIKKTKFDFGEFDVTTLPAIEQIGRASCRERVCQ